MGKYAIMRYKTKRRTKDLDLIYNELANPEQVKKLLNQPLDENLPGLGQYYCIHCDRYLETASALKTHLKGKVHRRRVKELKGVPYTQETSDAASGLDVNKFMKRVDEITNTIGPNKELIEKDLKTHLDTVLENASEIDKISYLERVQNQENGIPTTSVPVVVAETTTTTATEVSVEAVSEPQH